MPRLHSPDVLFKDAEQLASDFSLFPRASNPSVPHNLQGLVSELRVRERLQELRRLAVDEYVRESVAPAEDLDRPGIRAALKHLGWRVQREATFGPLYTAEVVLEIGSERRRVGLLAQDRSRHNGAWMPEHHLQAVQVVRRLALQLTPIVTFIDTPGAVADAEANSANQAHAISRLIAEMAQLHVPTVGIIYGNGYSGGRYPAGNDQHPSFSGRRGVQHDPAARPGEHRSEVQPLVARVRQSGRRVGLRALRAGLP